MQRTRQRLAGQAENSGHKKIRSHCNTTHSRLWLKCSFEDCSHRPFVYTTALESHLIREHQLSIEDASLKVKQIKIELMKDTILTKNNERRDSAMSNILPPSGIGELTLEDELLCEVLLDEEAAHEHKDGEEREYNLSKGDEIFPLSDEQLDHAQFLVDLHDFVTISNENDNEDNTQFDSDDLDRYLEEPALISLLDCETVNFYNFPDGAPCEIAVWVEGTPTDDIKCSKFDPRPHIIPEITEEQKRKFWNRKSIDVHHITPEDVMGQPLIENGIPALFRYITAEGKLLGVCGAFNVSFDKSRIQSCADKFLTPPNYRIVWIDVRKLIGDEYITDDEGRILAKVRRLVEIFEIRTKGEESLNHALVHSAKYDTYMMIKLLLIKFGTIDGVKEAMLKLANERNSESCQCTGGCHSCGCKYRCTSNCKCLGCQNEKGVRPEYELGFDYTKLTRNAIGSLSKQNLKVILHRLGCHVQGNKPELVHELRVAMGFDEGEMHLRQGSDSKIPNTKPLKRDHIENEER